MAAIPDASMRTTPDVFAPAQLGPLTLRNRIIKSATFEAATPDALVTDDLIEYHRLPAAGGVGMTTVAYCAVSPEGRTEGRQIWMRPEAVPGLRRLTEAIHAEGAAISAQIGHAGPVADARSNKAKALAPVRFFNPIAMRFAKHASRDDITDVIAAHADAARFAIDSGFDAVEIHLGHGYFCSSFLSPMINRRTDEFGGSLQNRAKVARGVVIAVRRAVDEAAQLDAKRIAVTAKLNMSDGVRGGITVDEALRTAQWLEEDGGLDALELTAGSSLVNPMYLFRGDAPVKEFANAFKPPMRWGVRLTGKKFLRQYPYRDAYLLDYARRFRAELKMPLILLGGITNRETMDLAMAEGFQFVAMARALLAEPDLVNRIRADGDRHSVRSACTHCNQCMPSVYSHTHCVVTGAPDSVPAALRSQPPA
jgi:2,4-dienoyl-CoA reductase-like NADH-dependent reductase (Old Yellow Enzyme family)